jgi:Mg-chelatase subunit ChlD
MSQEPGETEEEIRSASDWDVAIRYHEFKNRITDRALLRRLAQVSARAVIRRAQEVLGSMIHPRTAGTSPWDGLPDGAEKPELDLDATLENAEPPKGLEPWMRFETPKPHPVVLCVDTSLSMTGEKLALTAVALAVVLLQFPEDRIGIVAFETEAHEIKRPSEKIDIPRMIELFLEVPGQGYTDLEEGLRSALRVVEEIRDLGGSRAPATVLLTDGKYTAGKDPGFLGSRFPSLIVLKMGDDQSSLALCRELARRGNGRLHEVADLRDLPRAMFLTIKLLVTN